jgi:hypothetical protein
LYLEDFQEKVLDRFSFFRSTRKPHPDLPDVSPRYAMQEREGD